VLYGCWDYGGAAGVSVALETLNFGAHVRSVLIAEVAVLFEGAVNNVLEIGGNFVVQTDGRDGRFVQDGVEDSGGSVASERKAPGSHFVENDTEGKEVGSGVEFFTEGLLGGHVCDRAEGGAGTG
jgi:hypothetical protein